MAQETDQGLQDTLCFNCGASAIDTIMVLGLHGHVVLALHDAPMLQFIKESMRITLQAITNYTHS